MLFDLRSRGRRTTVRAVYLGLAILIGGGLILFGVGTGIGGGGLLNAFNGGGGNQQQVVSNAERKAEKAVKTDPSNPAAWASLVQARWTAATTDGTGFNVSTGTFTDHGKSELKQLTQAWERYLALAKSPNALTAILAARAYGSLNDYGGAARAWEAVTTAVSNNTTAYECLAVTAYAAGQTRKGDLAAAKVLGLLPKSQRTPIKTSFAAAKASKSRAQQIVIQNCER
ncbi:MAG: tetratricopeptide repeat protein [Solirubrobacteraceae bacterium]